MIHLKCGLFCFVLFDLIILLFGYNEDVSLPIGTIRHRKSRSHMTRSLRRNNNGFEYPGKYSHQDFTLHSVREDESVTEKWFHKTAYEDESFTDTPVSNSEKIFIKSEKLSEQDPDIENENNFEMEEKTEKPIEEKRPLEFDIVTKFLRMIEEQHLLGENCSRGTDLNLGEGVVDRYAQERFRIEADVAVNRANMLTRLWKYADPEVLSSEYLLFASVVSMVEFDDNIFAAGNCYDEYMYKDYSLFCPYAFRLPEGPILAKNLAVEYKYITNSSEWFFRARTTAERVIKANEQYRRGKLKILVHDYF